MRTLLVLSGIAQAALVASIAVPPSRLTPSRYLLVRRHGERDSTNVEPKTAKTTSANAPHGGGRASTRCPCT